MVLILDGNSVIGAHGDLISSRQMIRSTAVANLKSFKATVYLHACTTCSVLPLNIRTMTQRNSVKQIEPF